ncbi:MAG: hypothetical protein ACYTGP_02130 [Planctomycetota bacterium]|jgi:hypothetical protein
MTTGPHQPVPPKDQLELGEPYCGACGQRLTGLVDSSKCPECGRPIVEVVTRAGKLGTRHRSRTTLFGLPLFDVAFGATHRETTGKARGVFAFGDKARGLVAVGGTATGVVAIGGNAFGVFAVGGFSFGLVSSWGGISIGLLAAGGIVLGVLGFGGVCAALVASGGVAFGLYAIGGMAFPLAARLESLTATPAEVYAPLSWFFGVPSSSKIMFLVQPTMITIALPIIAALLIAALALVRYVSAGMPERP